MSIEAIVSPPMAESGRSSLAVLNLPSGYIDESNTLHTEITIREMDGRDEDLLANQKIPMQSRMNKLLESCVQSIGSYSQKDSNWSSILLDLPVLDRVWILLQLRIVTLGPIFSAKIVCQNEECKKSSQQNVDLNDLQVVGLKDPMKRTYSGVLPKSKKEFVCKIFNGNDENKLTKLIQKNSEDLISLAIWGRLLKLGDKHAPIDLESIKSLSLLDRQYLRNQFKVNEGEIDQKMECFCPSCGHEFSQSIEFDSNFFFPSET